MDISYRSHIGENASPVSAWRQDDPRIPHSVNNVIFDYDWETIEFLDFDIVYTMIEPDVVVTVTETDRKNLDIGEDSPSLSHSEIIV